MALIADFVWVFVQQLSMRRRMRIMTFRAFSRLHWGMHKRIFELFLEGIMALQTEFPLGARFQFKFILRKCNCNTEINATLRIKEKFNVNFIKTPHY